MQVLDPAQNQRLLDMLDLVATYSAATTPQQVMARFALGWRKLVGPTGYVSLACEGLEPGAYRVTRTMLDMSDDEISEDLPWPNVNELPVRRGGLLGRIVEARRPAILLDPPLAGDAVLGDAAAGFTSLMAIPLYHGGDITHWGVFFSHNRDAFLADHLPEHVLRSNLIGNTVRHVRTLQMLRDANNRIRRESTASRRFSARSCRAACRASPASRWPRGTRPTTRRAATCTTSARWTSRASAGACSSPTCPGTGPPPRW